MRDIKYINVQVCSYRVNVTEILYCMVSIGSITGRTMGVGHDREW